MSQEIKDTQATNTALDLDTVVTVDKSKNQKKAIAAIGVAVVLILAVVISVLAVSGNSGKKMQKQLDLGNKYLEEMDYEQAKYAFQAVLEIDPKNADAYEGLLKLYAAEQDAQGIADTYLQAVEYLTGEELDRIQKSAAEQLETLVKEALNAGEYDRAESYSHLLAQVDVAKAEGLKTQIAQAKAETERLAREQAEAEAERLAQEQAQAALANASVGEYISFGRYEQDNDTTNGAEPIEWQVLAKEEGRTLLISRYALDCKRYNEEREEVTWETCTLRNWMNNSFYNAAFDDSEQAKIVEVMNSNPDSYAFYNSDYAVNLYVNQWGNSETDIRLWGASGGNSTSDKVFLLSYEEALSYFNSVEERICSPTAYAIAQGAWSWSSDGSSTGRCWWWLRSPGNRQDNVLQVDGNSSLHANSVNDDYHSVRPALWIAD